MIEKVAPATSSGSSRDTAESNEQGNSGKFTWDNRRVNDSGHRFKMELIGSSIASVR